MVKLTASLVEKKCLQQQSCKSVSKEIEKDHLKKITHLFMNEQCIDQIDDFSTCKNLKVIYLQKNSIQRIENLNFTIKLTHLYLQHNEITKIENLNHLINLKKLYLGYNKISVIEGLDKLTNLSELHVEKQKLALGEYLCFDPRTANTLSDCLTYLNISENKLHSLSDITNFKKLITLEAKNNFITDIEDLTDTVETLPNLKKLLLQGNPVTKIRRYRENIIANTYVLTILDNKRITENSRMFLKRFKSMKMQQSYTTNKMTLSEDITSSLNLPPAFRESVSRAMFQNVNPKFPFSGLSVIGDKQPQTFPSWKSSSSVEGMKDNHIIPRQFWKHKSKKQTTKNVSPQENDTFLSN